MELLKDRWMQLPKVEHRGVGEFERDSEEDYRYSYNIEEEVGIAIPKELAEASLHILHNKKLNATEEEIIKKNISIDKGILSGSPVIKGTRIPVYLVLEYLSDGHSFPEIREEFPSIESDEQIKAAILFASEMCYSSLE